MLYSETRYIVSFNKPHCVPLFRFNIGFAHARAHAHAHTELSLCLKPPPLFYLVYVTSERGCVNTAVWSAHLIHKGKFETRKNE